MKGLRHLKVDAVRVDFFEKWLKTASLNIDRNESDSRLSFI